MLFLLPHRAVLVAIVAGRGWILVVRIGAVAPDSLA